MISDLHRIRFDVHKQYWRGVERLFGSLLAIVDGQNCAIQCISGDIRTVLGNFKSVFCTNVYIYINIVFFLQCIYIYVYICIVELCRFRSVCNNKNIRFFLSINWWFEIKVYMWFLASCCPLGTTVECASGISTRFGNRSSQPVPQSRYYFDICWWCDTKTWLLGIRYKLSCLVLKYM